jgi:hypothetical protein
VASQAKAQSITIAPGLRLDHRLLHANHAVAKDDS